MFLDPFIFNPPRPDFLTRAVESYQRVAAVRFCRYARDAEDPDLLPRKLSGLSLEPTPKQLHAEVRALRHLTAIQRTLRDIGGPLFDPASPVPPRQRFRLVERRMEAIEEALAATDAEFTDASLDSYKSCTSQMSYSSDTSDGSDSSHLDNPVNHVSDLNASPPGDFELHRARPGDDFYHPPEIEDLLEAVDFAQRVFAARAELLDKRRLTLSPEDFLLEIASLRDLTAVIRTLRRMSAHRLPENEPLPDSLGAEPARHSLGEGGSALSASSFLDRENYDPHTNGTPGAASEESIQRIVSCPQDASVSSAADAPYPAATPEPAHPLQPASHPAHETYPSPASSESVQSVKSVDGFGSGSGSGFGSGSAPPAPEKSTSTRNASGGNPGLVNSLNGDRTLRSVPRVPEVRPINTPTKDSSPAPAREGAASSGSAPPAPSASLRVPPNVLPNESDRSSHPSHPSLRSLPPSVPNSEIPNPKSAIPHPPPAPVLHDKDPPSDNSP